MYVCMYVCMYAGISHPAEGNALSLCASVLILHKYIHKTLTQAHAHMQIQVHNHHTPSTHVHISDTYTYTHIHTHLHPQVERLQAALKNAIQNGGKISAGASRTRSDGVDGQIGPATTQELAREVTRLTEKNKKLLKKVGMSYICSVLQCGCSRKRIGSLKRMCAY